MQETWVQSPGWGRSPGEGNDNPLQYSCLGNPTDREAWQATVHGVASIGHDLVTKPPLYSKVIQLFIYMYLFLFKFFSHLSCYIIQSRVPCAIQQALVSNPFYCCDEYFYKYTCTGVYVRHMLTSEISWSQIVHILNSKNSFRFLLFQNSFSYSPAMCKSSQALYLLLYMIVRFCYFCFLL